MSQTPANSSSADTIYSSDALDRLNDELQNFEKHAAGLAGALPAGAPVTAIGPYHILELIGEGGMGAVYKAEQRRPVRRIVALKVVKPGLDTREVLARFEAERQALARMDHPGIAKVLDAGADNLGRPYFVMEFVTGVSITKFCDEEELSLAERLELFTQVCDAMTHAHTKSILHRDIKASNVLAWLDENGKPVAKVIDFGVAKALAGDRLTEITFSTDRGVIVGTYDSMSPEQADGSRDIDTRTDVYSLGVLLYELLAGFKPIDREALTRANDYELRRIIREVEPPRPSARLSSMPSEATARIAAARHMKPDALIRELRGELEWIPLMALRKERERRYPSPQALGDDIRNYLAGRPLTAGPESRSYVAKKFFARHRPTVIGVAAALILAIAATSFYLHRIRAEQARTLAALQHAREQTELAEQQRHRAELERAVATNVKDFVADMLRALNPARARGRAVRIEDIVQESANRIEAQFKDQPDVEAQLRAELGYTLWAIGRADQALPHYERALALQQKLVGPDAKPSIAAELRIGEALMDLGRTREADKLLRETVARCERLFPIGDETRLAAQGKLGMLLHNTGPHAEAVTLLRGVYEQRLKTEGPDSIETIRVESTLGSALSRTGDRDEASALLHDALERRLRHGTVGDDPELLTLQQNLSHHMFKLGDRDEARALTAAALTSARRVYPEGHPNLVSVLTSYANLLQSNKQSAEAEPLAREAYTTGLRALGPDNPNTIKAMMQVQRILAETGRTDEAVPIAREALDRRRRMHGDDDPEVHDAMFALASTLLRAKEVDEAATLMLDRAESVRRHYGTDAKDTMTALARSVSYLKAAKRFADAERVLAEVLSMRKTHPGYMTPEDVLDYRIAHADAIKQQGRLQEAKPVLDAQLAELRKLDSPRLQKAMRSCLLALADIAESEGDPTKAAALREEAAHRLPTTKPATTRPGDERVALSLRALRFFDAQLLVEPAVLLFIH